MADNKTDTNIAQIAALKKLLNIQEEPTNDMQRLAKEYMQSKGMSYSSPDTKAKINPDVSSRVAKAFEEMKHSPNDPKVKASYDALSKEIQDQYDTIQGSGFKASKIESGMGNPYKSSSDLINDIQKNKHMWYFPTESGFGSDDAFKDHPLFKESKYLDPSGKPMKLNDVFRIVHDYFGHAKDANKFGATGEERAYLAHKKMLSPEAQKALATETRGQNSWVNYGPFGEENRASPANTKYADQKAGLLPDWATRSVDDIQNPAKYYGKQALGVAGKAIVPAAVGYSALSSDDAMGGLMDFVVPGGVETVGQGSDVPLDAEQQMAVDAMRQSGQDETMSLGNYRKLQKMLGR